MKREAYNQRKKRETGSGLKWDYGVGTTIELHLPGVLDHTQGNAQLEYYRSRVVLMYKIARRGAYLLFRAEV